jgi:glycosyltransferase involved in cell wall biosynthesis
VATTVAFVLKGYPRLSETFIAQEVRALEQRGLDIRLISLRYPTDHTVHPVHREIKAPINYLPEYLYREPLRMVRAWWAVRRRPGYRAAKRTWLADLRRDPTPNRVRRFGQALVIVHELSPDVGWLHAHFMHTPASVVRYAALVAGLPWSCSAHAVDIWTTPDWEKREKLAECKWLVTCTHANAEHLAALAPDAKRVSLVYHGLEFARFPAPKAARPVRDGSDPDHPVIVLLVGRAVEKKGYDVLLAALAMLPGHLAWRFVHVGGGEQMKVLKQLAQSLGIAERVDWVGARPQDEVLRHYQSADLFVLACRVGRDGNQDGLPNVLMEAQSQGLACLSTRLAGIAELIVDGETGRLVEPEDAETLAAEMDRLISDHALRARFGAAGLDRMRSRFSLDGGIDDLSRRFGLNSQAIS